MFVVLVLLSDSNIAGYIGAYSKSPKFCAELKLRARRVGAYLSSRKKIALENTHRQLSLPNCSFRRTCTHKPADHLACIFFSSLLVVTEIPTFALAKIHQSEDGVRWYNLHVKGLVPPFVAHLLSYSRGSFVKDRRRHMHRSSFFCKVWCEYVYAYKLSQTPVGIRCSCARCIAASFPFVAGPLRRLLPMPTSHTEGTMFWDPGIRPKAPSWEEFAILTCQWQ